MSAISIIGPGRHGTAIAQLFAAHGVDVTLFHHRAEKGERARAAVASVARGAQVALAASLEEAADAAGVVALTTLWDAPQRAVLGQIGSRLVGRVLLDVSNPLDVTPMGVQMRRPAEGSAGQFVRTLLPEGVGHAKAFSNLATATILNAADQQPPTILAFVADARSTADVVAPLLAQSSWQPWYVGDIDSSRDIEIGGKYNDVHGRYGRSALDASEFAAKFGPELLPA